MLLGLLMSCMGGAEQHADRRQDALERSAEEEGVATACAVAADCPILDLDASRCVSDPSWFDIDIMEGEVVAAAMIPGSGWEDLAPGSYYTAFASPTGRCDEALVVGFEVAP